PAGEPLGAPEKVWDQLATEIAPGDDGTFLVVAGSHLAALRLGGARPLWDVTLPSQNGYGHVLLAWDPDHAHWVIAGEQRIPSNLKNIPDTYRLFTARLDRGGGWIETPRFISPPVLHAGLGGW